MSDQYVGEIRLFPYPRGAPSSWQLCDGTLLSIADQEVLYTVIGTAYGGDGVNTFAVPDLRGRIRSIRAPAWACRRTSSDRWVDRRMSR